MPTPGFVSKCLERCSAGSRLWSYHSTSAQSAGRGVQPGAPGRHIPLWSYQVAGAQGTKRGQKRRATTDNDSGRLNADHSPDHSDIRLPATTTDLAMRAMPGQPRHAATCTLFASRYSVDCGPCLMLHGSPPSQRHGDLPPSGREPCRWSDFGHTTPRMTG